ncbi:MAG: transporter, partial [Tannerella sp.]|nr:transporter [Tannerella sp.]
MLKFVREWMLPLAMTVGALTHVWMGRLAFLTPYLIFLMLLVTFCKMSWKDIRFHPAHIWLLLIQLAGNVLIYVLVRPFDEVVAQGAMLCVLAPTATAAAVITGMLGGNVGFLTAYLLFCNVTVAVVAPIEFSMIGVHGDLPFLLSVWQICRKVFPLLVLPLLVAFALRQWAPKVHGALLGIPKLTFYLWTVALVIVTGITVHDMLNRRASDLRTAGALAAASLVICCLQFLIGRRIGRRYGDPVSSGQGLGQKNTILALWMAQTYLHPLAGIAPATYILWQNVINSYQLWRKNRKYRENGA